MAASAVTFFAAAAAPGQEDSSAAEMAAVWETYCGGEGVCRVISTLADEQTDEGSSELPPFYRALKEDGRPASECPEAQAAYAATGHPVDAFLGPCPDPADLPSSG